ncbi:MAG: SDR family oxidoreductase, partial [Pseudomonadales bacterium]|nr:SDR family oxidoreductase [Pseudomonadales bacterium]
PHNIRVNAICPGSVNGERIERVMTNDAAERGVSIDKIRATYVRQVSMRTFVDAEEIAEMVSFLADETGKRISGQIIAVDGHTEGLSNDFE